MKIYVESNFVLELTREQEQSQSCESILSLCESGRISLVVPAYCLVEPHETFTRNHKKRRRIKDELDVQLRQIARTATNASKLSGFRTVTDLLIRSTEQESRNLDRVSDRILRVAEVIPLDASILHDSSRYRRAYRFSPQDAIVYASVLAHLASTPASPPDGVAFGSAPPTVRRPVDSERKSYFVARDRHFDDPDVVEELGRFNCELVRSFDHGRHVIERSDSERILN